MSNLNTGGKFMESAFTTWLIQTGLPILVALLPILGRYKENERRVTLIEANLRHNKDAVSGLSERMAAVENSQIILGRMDERLKTMSEQLGSVQDDVKNLQKKT